MWFRKHDIRREVRRRKIELLLHSTHLYRNLPHILEAGRIDSVGALIAELGHDKAKRFLHDPNRYERFAVGLDYVNCSLTLPNVQLLYHRSKSEWQAEWVHLALDPALLYKEGTLFSPVSAAAGFGAHVSGGLDSFNSLFAEQVESYTRSELSESVPTHPQAECLIRGPIPIGAVQVIYVSSAQLQVELCRLSAQLRIKLSVEVCPQLFVWPERMLK